MSESHLEKLFEKVENKLDNISKELSEFKNGVGITMTGFSNRLENTENRVKNIENHLNKPFKDRILEMIISGITYTFSACLGVSLFVFILKGVGSNILNIIKPLLSGIIG